MEGLEPNEDAQNAAQDDRAEYERPSPSASPSQGQRREREPEGVSRRQVLKIAAGAVLAAPFAASGLDAGIARATALNSAAQDGPQLRFLTPDEFAMLDELTEIIVPTDDHSPGAKAAGVAMYIDARLAEAWEQKTRDDWRTGLKLIDGLAKQAYGLPFMQAAPEQRAALLLKLSEKEMKPQKPEEHFFVELKRAAVRTYYTSDIGIHREIEYKGNSYQKEFSGHDPS